MFKKHSLPALVLRIVLGDNYEERSGDLDELYKELLKENGRLHATTWHSLQILKIIFKTTFSYFIWSLLMFASYIKTAFRNLKRHKNYSLINIMGLSLGIASCMLALLWVQDETGYDRFHTNLERIHKVYSITEYENVQQVNYNASYYPLAALIKAEIPEIENTVRFMTYSNIQLRAGELELADNAMCFADPSFFDIFSFNLIIGNKNTAFNERKSIVITQSTAAKYFGTEDPMGKTINLMNRSDLIVTGIIEDIPRQSSFQFDGIAPFNLISPSEEAQAEWGGNPFHTFALLIPGAEVSSVKGKIDQVVQRQKESQGSHHSFPLHSLQKYHLYMPDGSGLNKTLLILSLTASFILLIACINFINLGTARASTRTTEVGLRKTVGATRRDIIKQFMGESFLLILIATVFACILALISLPEYCQIIQKQLPLSNLLRGEVVLGFITILICTVILTGAYPSWIMARCQPVTAIKGAALPGNIQIIFRRILVVFQFVLSVLMIIAMFTLSKQMSFIQHTHLGFETKNLLEIYLPNNLKPQYDAIKTQLLQSPDISNISMALQNPNRMGSNTSAVEWTGKNPDAAYTFNFEAVGFDYSETLRLQILEGRAFSKEHSTDENSAVIINEAAAKLMGMDNPVGSSITVWDNKATIIGLVKDFHCRSLHYSIEPLVFWIDTDWPSNMYLRISPNNQQKTIKFINETLNGFQPDTPIRIQYVEELRMQRNYQTEQRMGIITQFLTILALVISCLGLLGLATFVVEQKVKEIGIRKVLGASPIGIMFGLIKDFSRWVIIAILIAIPMGPFLVNKILATYAYQTPIKPDLYFITCIIVLGIACMAVSVQSLRAALNNPVNSIRAE
ncbi:ABC transporter permease [bacterium]|nr:ABC transporter permease [bacterium]